MKLKNIFILFLTSLLIVACYVSPPVSSLDKQESQYQEKKNISFEAQYVFRGLIPTAAKVRKVVRLSPVF
jgi:uncharacterized protein YcfL